jgi:GNAT superfamily N-acetyltransferase
VDVKPMPGLEHLPFAEVWFHEIDEARWHEASAAARAIGKSGLEAWTTDRTPEVAGFLEERGYDVVRRYVISELDVAAAPEPAPPQFELTTFAERPDLVRVLFEIARESYPDQPGRPEQRMDSFDEWRPWGLDPHPAAAYFIALEDARAIGYGFLAFEDDTWWHGFTAVARAARGRGVASSIKSAQLRWAKANGLRALRTANEERLTGMLKMNRRLGYRPLYTELVLRGPVAQVPPAGIEAACK